MENSSFSYKQFFGGNTLMVVVPHEDDEVNLAGAVIYGARQEGMRVLCVFVTNGDYSFPGSLRISEAIQSLSVLGVPEEDVIFLGYPDSGAHGERSVLLHGQDAVVQAGPHHETYGREGHEDFSYVERGHHQPYLWKNLLMDLKDVILKYRPSALIGTDFDSHADHRMVSIAFDKVMGMILNEVPGYRPLVLKGFCYATSYGSVKDFYGNHLLSTVIRHNLTWAHGQTTDNPGYTWDKRVRLPVAPECRRLLMENPIFYALMAHVSQKGHRRAKQVVNGDEVFWLRRTDNLLYEGKVTASSGHTDALHDFVLLDTLQGNSVSALWMPDADDNEKWCRVDFATPRHVESASLYGNVDGNSQILQGKLTFSNGFSVEVKELEPLGQETAISFPPQDDVKWVEFKVLDTEGKYPGLLEWELFASKFVKVFFLKICVNGQFAYDWPVYPREKMRIGSYQFGTDNSVVWFLNNQRISLRQLNALSHTLSGTVMIRAELADAPDIYDEIHLRRANLWDLFCKNLQVEKDHLGFLIKNNHQRKLYHQLRRGLGKK